MILKNHNFRPSFPLKMVGLDKNSYQKRFSVPIYSKACSENFILKNGLPQWAKPRVVGQVLAKLIILKQMQEITTISDFLKYARGGECPLPPP